MKRAKQITALIAIILLIGLYVATFIASFFSGFDSGRAFSVCLILTVAIPLLAFLAILYFGHAKGKKVIGDPDPIELPEEAYTEVTDDETVADEVASDEDASIEDASSEVIADEDGSTNASSDKVND